jgi:hypothetical protein
MNMEWSPLAPRARVLFHIQALVQFGFFWLPSCVFGGACVAMVTSVTVALVVAIGLVFVVLLLSLWLPTWSFERWGYALREEDLLIAHGVLVRSVTAIPTGRIQHVDTRQGPLEQWLGLARVHIYTASGMGADGVIPGLRVEEAETLRDQLVRAGGDDGV